MNKAEWIKIINDRQDMYVKQLASLITSSNLKKSINFNSPTGTGKTVMISKLINKMEESNFFFLITTLSKGGLNKQLYSSLKSQTKNSNYTVFGVSSFTASTKLQEKEILKSIPISKELIWIRDEGHIKSNNWTKLLYEKAYKIINVSATNEYVDIQCNFVDTPLLRTPYQIYGIPKEAIDKLLYVKRVHKNVLNYNPCLIVRDVSGILKNEFIELCNLYRLKYIDITEQSVNVQKLCENNNEYDVIINKMKIVEGIDIPRASVIYIGNRPSNDATIIQLIGRVRRNALLWNENIDIFAPENEELLKETSKTYVFYNKENSAIQMEDGEMIMELSNTISVEQLLPDVVQVNEGKLENGYKIAELCLINYNYSGELILSHNEEFVKITNLPYLYQRNTKMIDEFGTVFKAVMKDSDMVKIAFDKNIFSKINGKGCWRVSTTVSDNIKYGKLNKYVQNHYREELLYATDMLRNPTNVFLKKESLPKKLKVCINFIAKYYLKYLIYGKVYIEPFYNMAVENFKVFGYGTYSEVDIEIYAIYLCYRYHMHEFYGVYIERLIPTLSEREVIEIPNEIKEKIKQIAQIGLTIIMPVILKEQNTKKSLILSPHMGNPNIMHGVADIVTETSIVQLILADNIKQEDLYKGFALQFLSTRRYDLKIKNVVFYNINTSQIIKVPITYENLSKLKYCPAEISTKKKKNNVYYTKSFSSFKNYYSNYGKQMTLNLLMDYSEQLSKQKQFNIKTGKETKIVTQKQLLKSAQSIKDKDVDLLLLKIMKPSLETLEYAISSQNCEMIKLILTKIKPNKKIIDAAIKTRRIDIIEEIIRHNKIDVSNLITAIKENDDAVIEVVSNRFVYSRNTAKVLIRTKNVIVITKMFNNIVPTSANLITAIKTNDEEIVKIIIKKIPKVTALSLDVAKMTKNTDIIDIVTKKMYNKIT